MMMATRPAELEKHVVFTSERYESATRDYVKHVHHELDPIEFGGMEVHAVGYAKGNAKGEDKAKGKHDKIINKTWQEGLGNLPYTCHFCGEKGRKAA